MFDIFITIVLTNNVIKFIPIQKRCQLSENVFILMHLQICFMIAKMQIEIRLIENSMQHAKFQIFQRTLLDFNGTVMIQ